MNKNEFLDGVSPNEVCHRCGHIAGVHWSAKPGCGKQVQEVWLVGEKRVFRDCSCTAFTSLPEPDPTTRTEVNDLLTLNQWWMKTAKEHYDAVGPKADEYGGKGVARDLVDIGLRVARLQSRYVTDEEAVELGIQFYLAGKVARWDAAILDGRRVSDDTLLDIVIYGMMALRNRAVNGWPNGPRESEGDKA